MQMEKISTVMIAVAATLSVGVGTGTPCFAAPQADPHARASAVHAAAPNRLEDRYSAPIGHRQPRPQDLPRGVVKDEGKVGAWQRQFDQQLNICRDC
jgi:hypothetical protein